MYVLGSMWVRTIFETKPHLSAFFVTIISNFYTSINKVRSSYLSKAWNELDKNHISVNEKICIRLFEPNPLVVQNKLKYIFHTKNMAN